MKKGLSTKNLILLWVLGIAGQLCWNIENQWFNMYIYKYFPYTDGTNIITGMLIFSAIATAFSTFLFGTLSDRIGKRKPFIAYGYIIWGVFTFLFSLTGYLYDVLPIMLVGTIVVLSDSIMSFFGSMGNDTGFSAWTTDLLNDNTKGEIGIALAAQPVVGTIMGTVIGGILASAFGYQWFFFFEGALVSVIGIVCLFTMKDVEGIRAKKEGKFWHQFFSAFNFKKFLKIKELVLVFTVLAVYFIGFNLFFNYIGNIFVYNYGFNESNFGYIEGVGLVIAIAIMVFISAKVKKDRSPLMVFISIISEIVGLIVITILSKNNIYDAENLLSVMNLPLLIAVLIIGYGYVTFMQTIMIWAKSLYPEDERGQFEGIKIIAFVLIPMIFSSLISNVLIQNLGREVTHEITSKGISQMITEKVPNESLFIAAIIIMLLSLIPLYFVNKMHKERMKSKETETENK